jgi:hypothetical protein
VQEEHIARILSARKELSGGAPLSAFMHIFFMANKEKVLEVMSMSGKAELESLFREVGLVQVWEQRLAEANARSDQRLAEANTRSDQRLAEANTRAEQQLTRANARATKAEQRLAEARQEIARLKRRP